MSRPAWLQAATDASARSAEAQLAELVTILQGKQTLRYRWRLRNKGVDIDQLTPAALLVAILGEIDEVVNHE